MFDHLTFFFGAQISTQPHEAEAMLMPSKGWRDAIIPPGLKNRNRLKGRSLKTVLQEVVFLPKVDRFAQRYLAHR